MSKEMNENWNFLKRGRARQVCESDEESSEYNLFIL